MDPSRLMTIPCTLHHSTAGGPPDEYGDPTNVVTTTRSKCFLTQSSRREEDAGLPVEIERWLAYFPPDVTLDADDAVEAEGQTFQVLGAPWRAWHPIFRRHTHIEASLRRAQ